MIQRIQSIFILITAVCFLLFIHFPVAESTINETHTELNIISAFDASLPTSTTFSILAGVILLGGISSLITLFSFKKLYLQLRFCYLLIGLAIIAIILLNLTVPTSLATAESSRPILSQMLLGMAAICAFLARFFIQKDINLLKSLNRVR